MLLRHAQQFSPEEQQKSLQMIQEAGKQLESLTDRLLEIAQLEAATFQVDYSRVDIPTVAREAIGRAQQQVPEPLRDRLTLHLECRDASGNQTQEVSAVKGDVRCMRKVLEHLLENAIRFSPQGGRIDVIVRPAPQGRLATLQDQSHNGSSFLELCVCDFGVGIAPEHLERIFERFYRVETGLTRRVNGLTPYQIVCNGTEQKSSGVRVGLSSAPSRCTPLHKIRYGIEVGTPYLVFLPAVERC